MKTRALLTAAVLCLAGPAVAQAEAPATVRADMKDQKGQSWGEVTLAETPHGILVKGSFSNIPPGEHAVHIHETGKCEARSEEPRVGKEGSEQRTHRE